MRERRGESERKRERAVVIFYTASLGQRPQQPRLGWAKPGARSAAQAFHVGARPILREPHPATLQCAAEQDAAAGQAAQVLQCGQGVLAGAPAVGRCPSWPVSVLTTAMFA